MENSMVKKCEVDGCEFAIYAKGLCKCHYNQIKNYNRITKPSKGNPYCIVCGERVFRNDYCSKHYSRFFYTGDPTSRMIGDINDFVIDGDTVRMNLYKKRKIAGSIIFDLKDLDKVKDHHWYLGADGYASGKIEGKIYKFHKYILGDYNNEHTFDHINRIKIDNRRINLRIVTKSQNRHNSGPGKANKSGFKGVHFNKRDKNFVAQIRKNGKTCSLGAFITKEEAAIRYNNEALKQDPECAFLNKVCI